MSARGTMVHRAIIERQGSDTDRWGNPAPPSWSLHLHDLPCRAWFGSGREVIDSGKTAVIQDRRMVIPRDTDVKEGDRVLKVTNRKGDEVFDGPMRIEAVGRRQDHKALSLEAV